MSGPLHTIRLNIVRLAHLQPRVYSQRMLFVRNSPRLLLALVLLLLGTAANKAWAADVVLRVFDVGQGDAMLVESNGKSALIDTGSRDSIVDKLRGVGLTSLDLLLITHNHMDHFGAADTVLASLPVRAYLDNDSPAKTKKQETILGLVAAKKVQLLRPTARAITLGDATLRLLPPPDSIKKDDQNDLSVGVILERGGFRALLTGDSEVLELSTWLATQSVPEVDILKAPHHGSRNGLTPAWLKRTNPKLVVISVGEGNDYGHPHPAALRYYEAAGRRVLRTDQNGDLTIRVHDDGSYTVEAARGMEPITLAAGNRVTAGSTAKTPVNAGPAPAAGEPVKADRPVPAKSKDEKAP